MVRRYATIPVSSDWEKSFGGIAVPSIPVRINRISSKYDVDDYFGHYATDMTVWRPGSRWSWDGYHDLWTETVATSGGVAAAEVSDAQVRVSSEGDAAQVSYVLTADYHGEGGSVSRSTFQMSTTLMERDGQWKIIHLHFASQPSDN